MASQMSSCVWSMTTVSAAIDAAQLPAAVPLDAACVASRDTSAAFSAPPQVATKDARPTCNSTAG